LRRQAGILPPPVEEQPVTDGHPGEGGREARIEPQGALVLVDRPTHRARRPLCDLVVRAQEAIEGSGIARWAARQRRPLDGAERARDGGRYGARHGLRNRLQRRIAALVLTAPDVHPVRRPQQLDGDCRALAPTGPPTLPLTRYATSRARPSVPASSTAPRKRRTALRDFTLSRSTRPRLVMIASVSPSAR